MVLDGKIAQKIAYQVMTSLGYNVNIINHEGIIIGSGSPERMGSFHEWAMKVIKDNQTYETCEEEARKYPGMKEGVNMPIVFEDRVIGAVGISGKLDEVRALTKLVKMTAELILEQEALKEKFYSHQNNKTYFINNLISDISEKNSESILQWAKSLDYKLEIARVACIFKVFDYKKQDNEDVVFEEKLWERILFAIKSSIYHSKQDISAFIGERNILVFKTIKSIEPDKIRTEVNKYLKDVYKRISIDFKKRVFCYVGSYYEGVSGYRESYNEAIFLSRYVADTNKEFKIYFISEHVMENLYALIPKQMLFHILENYLMKLQKELWKNIDDMILTLEKLVENNFNFEKVAKELYIHKNTVSFRFGKTKSSLGLDPLNNNNDRVILWLLVLYYRNKGKDI